MHLKKKHNSGFTLIELMIAMAIASIVLAAIYRVFQTQQRSFTNQQSVVEMQQNARAAMTLMKREIRMAGYKPAASDGIDNNPPYDTANKDDADENENGRKPPFQQIGIMTAQRDKIMFRMDIRPDDPAKCSDGFDDPPVAGLIDDPAECYDGLADDVGEEIVYQIQGDDLVRWDFNSGGAPQILAYDIDAIAFGYAFDADKDGYLDTDNGAPDGNVIWAYGPTPGLVLDTNAETGAALTTAYPVIDLPVPPGNYAPIIGAVRIWLLARTPNPIKGEKDTGTYRVGDKDYGPPGSGADVIYDTAYRRTLQTTTVYCRNLRF